MTEHLYNENEWLKQIAAGNEAAFSNFFYRHAPGVYAFILKMVKQEDVARDLLQEVFIKAWLNRTRLPEINKPVSWLLRIASNLSINHLRRKQIEARWLEEQQVGGADGENNAEKELLVREVQSLIGKAVTLLPAQRRRIYELSREEGCDRREIAIRLGISENTVKNQLVISLKFIRRYLIAKGVPYLPLILLTGKILLSGTVQAVPQIVL
ncbi:RNA polymerase sigma-70 factor [Chitinophaga sp. MM2321]|uniref:RNA polymerase sigma factor n=1 Tax=Chitinophaga sp. MM2321 TaxID=3137178 RepID=UPI0032D56AB1